jgi:hypothetical protein
MCNEVWYEKIGTARQFALAQPNAARSMEHTWTTATVAKVQLMQNKRSSLVAARFREIRRL